MILQPDLEDSRHLEVLQARHQHVVFSARGGAGRQSRGDAGDHMADNASLPAGRQFLPAPTENEWIAALKPDHRQALRGESDQHPVDLLLGVAMP